MFETCSPDRSVVAVRPYTHKELLNIKDIKPGLRIQLWRGDSKAEVLTVASYPYFGHQSEEAEFVLPGSVWVDVESSTIHGRSRSLSDMGIAPYGNGHWNRRNHSTKAEPLSPKTISADSAIDFFRSVSAWLEGLDNRGSNYRYEPRVEVAIPCSLRHAITPHEAVHAVKSLCSTRDVTVAYI